LPSSNKGKAPRIIEEPVFDSIIYNFRIVEFQGPPCFFKLKPLRGDALLRSPFKNLCKQRGTNRKMTRGAKQRGG